MNNVEQVGHEALLAAHANLDSIKTSGINIRDFIYARTFLAACGIKEDAQGKLPTVAAHLYAREQYKHFADAMYHSFVYNLDTVYVAAVEKYAEQVETLVKYRNERGDRNFDEQDFLQYLNLGVLAGGWL
jgi:tripartite-type tricarboxylate transporter receptor subunit TctC